MNYNKNILMGMTATEIGEDLRETLEKLFADQFKDCIDEVDVYRKQNKDGTFVEPPQHFDDMISELAIQAIPESNWQKNLVWAAVGSPWADTEHNSVKDQIHYGLFVYNCSFLEELATKYGFFD